MVNKELKRLSRRELVDIIYQLKKNEQQLQEKIASLEEALQDKRIRLSEAGSIAEAAAGITNVFSAAQTTADLYLREIACMKEDTEKECEKMLSDTRNQIEKITAEYQKQFATLRAHYQQEYKQWQQLQGEIQALNGAKENEADKGDEPTNGE